MQEKRGVTHINMMDLLQQYAIGNGKFSAAVNANHLTIHFQCERQWVNHEKLFYWFPIPTNYQLLNDVGRVRDNNKRR